MLTAVAYFMVTLDTLVVVTALPSIHESFGGGIATLQWTVSAYTIAFGAGILTAAALGDRLGRRRVYVVGLALFTAASAACALAPDANLLIAFRAIQGIGAAIVMPLSLTILTSAFPIEKRGAVVGIWGGIAGLAVAAGPLIGGGITQGLNWHWIFWVNVPIGVAATVGAALRLPESYGPRARLDVPALVLVSGGVAVLIWGLVQGGQNGWGTSQNLIGLFVGAAMLAGFVWWEGRAPEPMIPLSLFKRISFSSAVTTQFFMAAAIFSAAFLTSQYFQFARGDSPLGTGLRFLPWTGTPLVIAPIAGALSDRTRRPRAHRAGSADAGVRLRVDGPPRGDVCPLHQLRRSLRHCRRRHIDGVTQRHRRRAQCRATGSVGKGGGHAQHDAAVRCCLRRRRGHRGVQRARQPRHLGRCHERIPRRPWPCRPAPRRSARWLPWASGAPGPVAPASRLRPNRRTESSGKLTPIGPSLKSLSPGRIVAPGFVLGNGDDRWQASAVSPR